MRPVADAASAQLALDRYVGRPVFVHAESIPGGFLRNMPVTVRQAYVRGGPSARVALRCDGGAWVRIEDVTEWDEDGARLVFLGYGDGDSRMRRTLEISEQPFPDGPPEEVDLGGGGATARRPLLLVVLAHPDDETFICGGGLAAFTAAGGDVHLVCATRGEHGRRLGDPAYTTREGLPVERESELRAACAALGLRHLSLLGLRDKCLEYEDLDLLAARIAGYIRGLRPDGVLTFHEDRGGHPDHCTIGRAATLAWRMSGDPTWHPEQLAGRAAHRPPRLYFLAGGDLARSPERHGLSRDQFTVVDCASVARQKMLAHRAHRTQTQMDRGLWEADAAVLGRFAHGREHYQQANAPYAPGERGLLGMQP